MSDIPPKNGPHGGNYGQPQERGVVAMYNAASNAGAEPFPVLKAFQDYIEAERNQARKRIVHLSLIFTLVIVLVVVGFFAIGLSMFNNMSQLQSRLLDAALRQQQQTPAPAQPVQPVVVQSAPQPAPAAASLPPEVAKKIDALADLAGKMNEDNSAKDGELAKLREEMEAMRRRNEELQEKMAKKAEQAAQPHYNDRGVLVLPKPPESAPQPVVETPALEPVVEVKAPEVYAKTEEPKPEPVAKVEQTPEFPPATKEPPKPAEGVTAPEPPTGMMATAIPVKTKNCGVIPWRLMIPE